MVYLNLHLTSSDKTFEYYFLPKKILEKNYEIALIKLDAEINNSNLVSELLIYNTNMNENNNLVNTMIKEKNKNIPDDIYINCNLIDYSYVNENNINSLYRIRNKAGAISIEPKQLVYHKVPNEIKKINIRLVDDKNNLIKCNNIDLYLELHLKEV